MEKQNLKNNEISILIQLMNKDHEIKKRITKLLQLNSYNRRFELNVWLEKLRQRNASENLSHVLSRLFDDRLAEQILILNKKSHNSKKRRKPK
jgi:hypothetical protein